MYEARSAWDIQIYEFIVIEFFFRLKIGLLKSCVPWFDIENPTFIVSINQETLASSHIGKPVYCARLSFSLRYISSHLHIIESLTG